MPVTAQRNQARTGCIFNLIRRDNVNPCSHYGMPPVFWGDPGASISSLLSARWVGPKLEMVLSFLIQFAAVAGLQTI